jgi:hypothetical protein
MVLIDYFPDIFINRLGVDAAEIMTEIAMVKKLWVALSDIVHSFLMPTARRFLIQVVDSL